MTATIKGIQISDNNLIINYTGGSKPPEPTDYVACTYSKTYVNPKSVVQQDSGGVDEMVTRCTSKNEKYVNTSDEATCIINTDGQGYDYDQKTPDNVCVYGSCMIYDSDDKCIIDNATCKEMFTKWKNKGVTKINYDNKEMMLGIGHGVLKGGRGQCAILEYNNKYAAIFQVDARTWSLEITEKTWQYLIDPLTDPGGTCIIPNVKSVDCNEIMKSF